VTTLDRAIHGEASRLIANYRTYSDEIDWLIGFRTHSPHSHAVPYLQGSLVRFRDEMILAREDDCDDAESFKKILENMWSKLDASQNSRQDFRTWVGKTRVQTSALRMAMPIEPTGAQLTASCPRRRTHGLCEGGRLDNICHVDPPRD